VKRTILIASAAYIEPEMEAEFGHLPPTFLPIGNRRLFVRQLDMLAGQSDRILISLPEDFVPDPADMDLLHDRGAEIVSVPAGLSLGESIVYVINVTAASAGPLAVLLGDTLLGGVDLTELDVVSTGTTPPSYRWGKVRLQGEQLRTAMTGAIGDVGAEGEQALSGWFCFADPQLLVQMVTRAKGDFIAALGEYSSRRGLRTAPTRQWLDFGHSATYHQSRRRMTTEREFNHLEATRRTIVKSSRNNAKIKAEALWFERLPPHLRIHAPAYLGHRDQDGQVEYSIEYLHLPTLTDLFVFGRVPRQQWARIFDGCDEFLSGCAAQPAPMGEASQPSRALYADKTFERLEAFARSRSLDLTTECRLGGVWLPSLKRMAELALAHVAPSDSDTLTLVHGDFCFSNILYDIRAELLRVIDPRGTDAGGNLTPFGDLRYDLGKLHHSVVGRYDHIVAGYYRLHKNGPFDMTLDLPETPLLQGIETDFLSRSFAGRTPGDAAAPAIAVLLFLSMLPLHADAPDRQDAFLANAMRLFLRLDRDSLPPSATQGRRAAR
jgi:hypothetical protein